MTFDCPLPTALTTIPQGNCILRFDQIVRLLVTRRSNAAFASETALKTLATWTPLLAATDSTKVVTTPVFSGLVIPSSAGQFAGGNDNTTFAGIREYYGEDNVEVTGMFKNLPSVTKEALKLLSQESVASPVGHSNIVAFFVNKDGVIFSNNLKGFEIFNFRVGTIGSEGLKAPNNQPFSFDMLESWDKAIVASKPTFDPLVDLV